jgi:sugar phosphate isomerase/epimerase
MIDIDHFKVFNDMNGHPAGDNALRVIGRTISEQIRDVDFAARYGGEEFAVILPDTTADQARIVAERIRKAGRTFVYHNHNFEFARFGNLTGMEILLGECGDAVQFEPDTYWVQAGGGDVAAWLGRLAGRIDVVHFKDMVYDIGEGQAAMAEVGEGNLDWPRIISACRAAGTRWHVVEQDICRRDPFDSLKLSLENLRRFGLE